MSKKKRKLKIKLSGVLFVICAIVFIVSLVQVGRLYFTQKKEENTFEELREVVNSTPIKREEGSKGPSKYEQLHPMNEDYVAWINIPNTHVDYPVMYTPNDPEFYLRRDFDKKYANAGTPFVGADCDIDSLVTIIYGHNMKNKTIFGDLDKYKSIDFCKQNPTFTIETEKEVRTYKVFANVVTDFSHDDAFGYHEFVGDISENDYNTLVNWCITRSPYQLDDRPEYGDQIAILSTCSYHDDNGRYILVGYRVE